MRFRLRTLTIIEWLVIIGAIFVLLAVWWPSPFPLDFDAPPHRAKSTRASKNEEIGANLSHRGAEKVADEAHSFDQPLVGGHGPPLVVEKLTPQFIASVSAKIPIGVQVAEARKFMEDEGFECSIEEADSYLLCRRHESAGFLIERVWTVAFHIRESKVVEINGSTDLSGP